MLLLCELTSLLLRVTFLLVLLLLLLLLLLVWLFEVAVGVLLKIFSMELRLGFLLVDEASDLLRRTGRR